jgi:signal peptidase I
LSRLTNRIITAVLVVAVIVAGLVLLPSVLGFERYVIETESMTGTIDKGSIVYSKPVDANELEVGDIITYRPPPGFGVDDLVTHRIISIEPAQVGEPRPVFRTKGDANPTQDPWRFQLDDDEAALEKAHLPYLGYVYLALAVPWVRVLLITLPAILIAVLTVVSLWREAGFEAEEERERLRQQRRAVAGWSDGAPVPGWSDGGAVPGWSDGGPVPGWSDRGPVPGWSSEPREQR